VDYVEGATEFAPADLEDFTAQTATQLAQIHSVAGATEKLSFLPKVDEIYLERFKVRPAKVDESIGEGRIRDVLEAVWPLHPLNNPVLLHGDFWPGNILWRDDRLVAVIDWEDARLGDPVADLANARLEMIWAFGIDAMHSFTQHYQHVQSTRTTIDYAHLPYWDLFAALRPAFKISGWAGNNAAKKKSMRERHRAFVDQAFEKLTSK
jgi:aminoglycoside phosphotransferase (APT) family kinase protein